MPTYSNSRNENNISLETVKRVPEYRIEPPNWWIGFKNTQLQLMVYKNGIGATEPHIDYPGISIIKTTQGKSSNYLFIDLSIAASTPSGSMKINFKQGNATVFA